MKWEKTFPKDNQFYLYAKNKGIDVDKLLINGPGGLEYSIFHQEKNKTADSRSSDDIKKIWECYFQFCNDNDVKIEYTNKFKLNENILKCELFKKLDDDDFKTWERNSAGGTTDFMYGYKGLYQNILNSPWEKEYQTYKDKGHHFWLDKWLIQDIMKRGSYLPLQVSAYDMSLSDNLDKIKDETFREMEVRTDSNMWYRIHPGTGKINILAFLDLLEWPAIIFSRKSHNLDYGGQEIKSLGDMKIITGNVVEPLRYEYDFEWSDFMGIYKLTIQDDTDYKKPSWEYDRNFYNVFKNTLPLRVYSNSDRFESKVDGFEIELVQVDDNFDKFSIPKLNDFNGFAIYYDKDIELKRENILHKHFDFEDIFEVFYYVNTDNAMTKNSDKLIVFNCEHNKWKTDELVTENEIGKLHPRL